MDRRDGGETAAGIVLGVGLGGLFDGIVFHQLLQWHHMVSGWRAPETMENMALNTLWDGLFHVLAYAFVVAGLLMLWRVARRPHFSWSGSRFIGTFLIGWGGFNIVEGLVDHIILGVHHVNERVPASQWAYWDWGFIVWGVAFVVGGWALAANGRRSPAPEAG